MPCRLLFLDILVLTLACTHTQYRFDAVDRANLYRVRLPLVARTGTAPTCPLTRNLLVVLGRHY